MRVQSLKKFAHVFGRYSSTHVHKLNDAPAALASTHKKHPLTDLFGRKHTYLRISLTEKCNLRCQYCMPSEGVPLQKKDKILTKDEILELVELFAELGVNKVRLTGGEPTVRRELAEIIQGIKSIKGIEKIGITTNGLTLTRQLVALQRAGLTHINISLDTMKPEKFQHITRRTGFEKVIAGIDLALQLGYEPVKVNCVLMKDFNFNEINDFVEFTRDRNIDIRFIEFMPFTGNKWDTSMLISYKEMVEAVKQKYPDFKQLDPEANEVAKEWKVAGFKGSVGFITSMTENFCSSCNRIRITADGNLKVCLFGNKEVSLRDALRAKASKTELTEIISEAILKKHKRHAEPGSKSLRIAWSLGVSSIKNIYPTFQNRNTLQYVRYYSTSDHLTHVDSAGKSKMVDVSPKAVTTRIASAAATIEVGEKIIQKIKENQVKKGDVLTVAQLAGIMAAKKTSDLIPLCHPLNLSSVNVSLSYDDLNVHIVSEVKVEGKTGIEMEALTAVTVAALTVYDMCKAMSHDMVIKDVRLLSKSGGKSEYRVRDIDRMTIKHGEIYAPTNFENL